VESSIKTNFTITIGFVVLSQILHIQLLLFIGVFVGVLSLSSNKISLIIELIWNKLTMVLSQIIPNVILVVFFYFFLFPIALMNRLIKRNDPLNLKNTKTTLFTESTKVFVKSSLENTW
jgi:hypothetical protein